MNDKNPNCSNCTYYYITLDERHPKACRVFNIKSRNVPSIDIRRLTGHICPAFEKKSDKLENRKIKSCSIIDTFA